MALKEKDFIKVAYTARIQPEGRVFDTTDETVAKKEGVQGRGPFGPQTICLGQGFILAALEKKLIGKEKGKYTIELPAADAFGKKDAKLLRLFPTKKFLEQRVMPEPGVVVNMDGNVGMIKTVNGGRVTVDFNHPLSGKDVVYDVEVLDTVTDMKEKVVAVTTHMVDATAHIDIKDDKATIGIHHNIPAPIASEFKKKIIDLTGIKDVTFDVHKHA